LSKLLFLFICLIAVENNYAQYISPGIRLGYDFNSHTTFEVKVSVGLAVGGSIYNITVGKKYSINNKETYLSHNYIDLQAGDFSKPSSESKTQLFYGAGIGMVFYDTNGTRKYRPRITVFAGYLLFTTFDFYLNEQNNVESDLGLQLVLPIPLGGIDFGSPGG